MNTVVFDLDGTLSDSAEGIIHSINHALKALGRAERPRPDLIRFVGPHLFGVFSELLGTTDQALLDRAVAFFRERYIPVGYKESRLYDGILKVLSILDAEGGVLCVVTTKRRDVARNVLRFFGIEHYFAQIHGCDLHGSKADLLRQILAEPALTENPAAMVGDRDADFLSATEVGIPSIGVRWGYGSEEELALATAVVDSPSELPEAIRKHAKPPPSHPR